MGIYFVFWEDLIPILTTQKDCNWFRILLTKISMLTKTNICSDWNHLMGNNGANWIPATGGRSSKRNTVFCDCTPEKNFCSKEEMSKFPSLCKIAMRILTMFGFTYCTAASLFRYELHKERAAHLYDKWKHSPLLSSRYHYLGTKIEGTGKK